MDKPKITDLTALGPKEAENLRRTTKYLGATALLVKDVESLYIMLTPLVRPPSGDIDSDERALFVALASNQFMMSRLLFTKAIVAGLRMYQGDALTNLRRAIETCVFTVRMSKHLELCRVWCEAGIDDRKYQAYRNAFMTKDAFPKSGHPDFDPLVSGLKQTFDAASKQLHGSVFGAANHFRITPRKIESLYIRSVNFFDMPPKSFPSVFFNVIFAHMDILKLYGRILEPYLTDYPKWRSEFDFILGRVGRHYDKWVVLINHWSAERNKKQTAK